MSKSVDLESKLTIVRAEIPVIEADLDDKKEEKKSTKRGKGKTKQPKSVSKTVIQEKELSLVGDKEVAEPMMVDDAP